MCGGHKPFYPQPFPLGPVELCRRFSFENIAAALPISTWARLIQCHVAWLWLHSFDKTSTKSEIPMLDQMISASSLGKLLFLPPIRFQDAWNHRFHLAQVFGHFRYHSEPLCFESYLPGPVEFNPWARFCEPKLLVPRISLKRNHGGFCHHPGRVEICIIGHKDFSITVGTTTNPFVSVIICPL